MKTLLITLGLLVGMSTARSQAPSLEGKLNLIGKWNMVETTDPNGTSPTNTTNLVEFGPDGSYTHHKPFTSCGVQFEKKNGTWSMKEGVLTIAPFATACDKEKPHKLSVNMIDNNTFYEVVSSKKNGTTYIFYKRV